MNAAVLGLGEQRQAGKTSKDKLSLQIQCEFPFIVGGTVLNPLTEGWVVGNGLA
jgi:hypothetical protein